MKEQVQELEGFLGLSDFPLLLGIKIKFLYDVASIYGYDVKDYRERIYILNILQLAFSSQSHINTTFKLMDNWDEYIKIYQMISMILIGEHFSKNTGTI